jgi:hypothetical protein
MMPGASGTTFDTPNAISRLGTPVLSDTARQAELEKLSSSPASEQMRIMQFLVDSTQLMKPPPVKPGLYLAPPSTAPVDDVRWTADAHAAITPLAGSTVATVRGAALRALAGLPDADQATLIATMLSDADPVVRMLGLDMAEQESDHGLAADQVARDDPDELVRALAQGRLELMATPTTQTTTQPSATTSPS